MTRLTCLVGSVLASTVLCTACQAPDHYAWGSYENSVYSTTSAAGEVDVGAEIHALTQLVEKARDQGKPVPPGLHAHIGYLYSLQGDIDTAVAAFETEKELYPESTVFVDGILARIPAER